ncbi:MAG: ABC transporter permease [Candidatus Obscuribacterales bacterium]
MRFWELILLAWHSIAANRMRSCLTMLGIVIGIAAVIALLAIGHGAKEEADKQIKSLGTNFIFVRAGQAHASGVSYGMGSSNTLTWEDAEAMREICPAIEDVCPGVQGMQQVQYGAKNTTTNVCAIVPDYEQIRNFHTATGRFINQVDLDKNSRVVVLGEVVKDAIFDKEDDAIGKNVLIKGENFSVIGVMEHKGSTAFTDMDDQVFIPLTTGFNRIFGMKPVTGRAVQFILVSAKSEDDVVPAEFQITNLLRQRHRITDPSTEDFMLRTQKDLLQTSQNITGIFTSLLGSTAAISLIVGGIGIMNIMLVSVTERTREIGVRKAVGAKYADIMWQFVIEATVLSLAGGIIGIAIGIGASYAVTYFAKWTTVVTPISVVLAFGVSIIVGLFFGVYPARQAAKLDPIVALRTE